MYILELKILYLKNKDHIMIFNKITKNRNQRKRNVYT